MSDEKKIDELVKKAKQGDQNSFCDIYELFLVPVFRYILFRVSSEKDAEDLTEEIFFKILQKIDKYQKRENLPFSTWVFRIAKNSLIDFYRQQKKWEEISEDIVDDSENANFRKKISSAFDRIYLNKALKSLPENQAQSIILKFFSDRNNSEIAQILGKSEVAVRILQSRGLKKLKTILDNNF